MRAPTHSAKGSRPQAKPFFIIHTKVWLSATRVVLTWHLTSPAAGLACFEGIP